MQRAELSLSLAGECRLPVDESQCGCAQAVRADKALRWTSLGGLFAALGLCGACCLLPAGLMSVGLVGSWVGSMEVLAPYRGFFALATIVLLGPAAGFAVGPGRRATRRRILRLIRSYPSHNTRAAVRRGIECRGVGRAVRNFTAGRVSAHSSVGRGRTGDAGAQRSYQSLQPDSGSDPAGHRLAQPLQSLLGSPIRKSQGCVGSYFHAQT